MNDMAAFDFCGKTPWLPLRSTLVSFVIVLLSHLALVMVSRLFTFLSLLVMLPIAGFVLFSTFVLAGGLRRILGITASAPAMVVCNILFLWAVYIKIIREVIPTLLDASLNMEFLLLLFGLYRMFSGDPGLVSAESIYYPEPVSIELSCSEALGQINSLESDLANKSSLLFSRVRCCSCCKRYVKGFDHHCPAFGNCIDIKISSGANRVKFEECMGILPGNLVTSTMLFSFLQVLWQVPFLSWHIYCISYNIKTEEWINWRKYHEFQIVVQPQQASWFTVTRFVNPYNNGILRNIREYLTLSLYSKHFIV